MPAIGITISVHHCGNKITSVAFTHFDNDHDCPCGSKKMKKNCCTDETVLVKLEDGQQKTQETIFSFEKGVDFKSLQSYIIIPQIVSQPIYSKLYSPSHPPNDIKVPPYIQHRVFRI